MPINPLAHALSSVVPGPEVSFNNLVMIPLLKREFDATCDDWRTATRELRSADRDQPAPLEYHTLDQALASGQVEVTEVSEDGSVPRLRVVNRGPHRTLIVDGEELVGAKQNRVVNLSILVDAHSEVTIPVSCVEAGRWRARSRAFSSTPRTQYASGRAKRMAQVSASLVSSGTRLSDQTDVWSDIACMSERLRSESPTGAMEAIFVNHAEFIDSCVAACPPMEGQIGALFGVSGRLVGLDLFDSEATLRTLLPKLVRSVAVDALSAQAMDEAASASQVPLRTVAGDFLAAIARSPSHAAPAVGVGEDVRLTADGLTGAALVVRGRVVHLSAFVVE